MTAQEVPKVEWFPSEVEGSKGLFGYTGKYTEKILPLPGTLVT